jgi:hypothetical protein
MLVGDGFGFFFLAQLDTSRRLRSLQPSGEVCGGGADAQLARHHVRREPRPVFLQEFGLTPQAGGDATVRKVPGLDRILESASHEMIQ